jgi:hypothetical protein
MLENIFNNIVDNENMKVLYILLAIEGVEFGYEWEGSRPNIDEGMPNMEAPLDHFQLITELEAELATSKALLQSSRLILKSRSLITWRRNYKCK